MKKPVLVGIDVSARTFLIAEEFPGRAIQETELPNTEAGHRKLCRRLRRSGRPAHVCLEASGIYHVDLALALQRTKNVPAMVANPRATRDFTRARKSLPCGRLPVASRG